jgi:hydroxymethylbilane synthase
MIKKIRIGTRGSKLALWQANLVKTIIEKHFDSMNVQIKIIQTKGDRDQASSLTKIGGQGIFTKAIENELINNSIDFAVHSLKDLPSSMPDNLSLGAVLKRGVVNDAFIGLKINDFTKLQTSPKIATGSIRRRAQILSMRPDIKFVDLRGNIESRIHKLFQYGYDGILVAEAAIKRLNLDHIHHHRFSIDEVLPAIGQGAIGVQVRKNDEHLLPVLEKINDDKTLKCVTAERAFLNKLDSGCQFPIAAYAKKKWNEIIMQGLVLSMDGRTKIHDTITGPATDAKQLGETLAQKLIERGAKKLLEEAGN